MTCQEVSLKYSPTGDFRQWVGEDKRKVQMIVQSNMSDFSEIYHPRLVDLVDFCSDQQMSKVLFLCLLCLWLKYVILITFAINECSAYLNKSLYLVLGELACFMLKTVSVKTVCFQFNKIMGDLVWEILYCRFNVTFNIFICTVVCQPY